MRVSRRSLFEEFLAAGTLAALACGEADSQASVASGEDEIRSSDFWNSYYDSVTKSKGAQSQGESAQGKNVQFFYFDKNGLRDAHRLQKDDLLDHQGDVTVDVVLGQFRPGKSDLERIQKYTSSQLRIECLQTRPFLNILAPATWVALASLYTDRAGKLPSLQALGFQQPNLMSGANKVILPGGSGKFSVNVSSMTKESKLHAVLRTGVKIGGMLSPLLGFPAISIAAAQTFTALYSLLEERASFIMSSPLASAAATKTAVDDPEFPQKYLPLKSGEYVIVPEAHLEAFDARLGDLQLNQGYVIDPALDKGQPVDRIAENSIPDVTYVSLKMTVKGVDLPAASGDAKKDASDAPPSTPKKKK
jgi:hypothetical protein